MTEDEEEERLDQLAYIGAVVAAPPSRTFYSDSSRDQLVYDFARAFVQSQVQSRIVVFTVLMTTRIAGSDSSATESLSPFSFRLVFHFDFQLSTSIVCLFSLQLWPKSSKVEILARSFKEKEKKLAAIMRQAEKFGPLTSTDKGPRFAKKKIRETGGLRMCDGVGRETPLAMNPQLLFYRAGHRFMRYRQHLKTRRAYCMLSLVNYTAGLIIASWLFYNYPFVLDILFCISSALIGISITALYLSRPLCMLPDIFYKMSLVTMGLFFGFVESESMRPESFINLALVALAVLSQVYENYFLFNAIATLLREKAGLRQSGPPPTYRLFATDQSKWLSPGDASSRPSTPPPSYADAVEMLRQNARSHTTKSPSTFLETV
ncbi:unnamed protein product [Caenorhabditis auriculariae]|uniref:Uncharacterized protein n=1 Tax=Caenorhabditis auriculariae TaxID=2777116 RepID=A0A8S1GY16_9PELO|nr:unnamed protein product [Caenorhabditis auriculariae]